MNDVEPSEEPVPQSTATDEPTFHVPRKLSMASLLCGMFAFSAVFAVMRYAEARPMIYAWVVGIVASVAVAQMVFESSPRMASAITGAIFHGLLFGFPIVSRSGAISSDRAIIQLVVLLTIGTVLGALIGYATGGVLAGFWLVADFIERRYALVTRRTDA